MSQGQSKTWAVVGGGMMGLTLAWRLAQAGKQVTLFEASQTLGGLAAPWSLGDITWDRHYHVTLLSDLRTRAVLEGLGLESTMRWVETKTGFLSQGKLSSMSNAVEYLKLPGLSLVDKFRVGATIVYGSRVNDWRALEQTPVRDWLTGLSGASAFERLWQPLLEAKLGDAWRESSAAFIWATIQRLYAARRTGLKKEMFGYVPGGYARIVERFEEVLRTAGVNVQKGQAVQRIEQQTGGGRVGLRVSTADASSDFDRVVLTTTPRVCARMCPGLSSAEQDAFNSVAYQGVVCASLLLERPLGGYYLSYLLDPGLPFTALVEMSAFVDPTEFGGKTLAYLPRYAPASDPAFEWSDEHLREVFLEGLLRVYPPVADNPVHAFRISRVKEVFPLPRLGYSSALPPATTSIPGLTAVSSAHIVNGTLNVNDTLTIAERAARSLLFNDGRRVYLD